VYQTECGDWQEFLPPAGFERNDMFMTEMRHFISVLKGESLPLCTLEDGVSALVLALAAHESNQHTKMVKL
jgi:predicted dehydrogenase